MKKPLGKTGKPGVWQAWVPKQDAVWVDIKGNVLTVASIEGRYALNILKFIYRLHRPDLGGFRSPLFLALSKRVQKDMGLYGSEIITLMNADPD